MSSNIVVFDGAMGTELYAKGVFINRCFDQMNVSNPDLVRDVHRSYRKVGVDVLETNTFGANRCKLEKHGLHEQVERINAAGVELAREIAGDDVYLAASVGPLGIKIEPWGATALAEAREVFREQLAVLAGAGVDLISLETFSDLNEIHQAILAARDVCDLPLAAHITLQEDGSSLYGTAPEVFARKLEEWGADIVGVNCSVGPLVMLKAVERILKVISRPVSVQPNAGMPRNVEGRNIYLCSPEYMGTFAKRYIQTGAKIVGGCCGTSPEHLKAILKSVRMLRPAQRRVEIFVPSAQKIAIEPVRQAEKSKLAAKISRGEFVTSVELNPPKGTDPTKVLARARFLADHGVDAINIPDGARASARMGPMFLALMMERDIGIQTILHYCCRDRNLLGMQADLLGAYAIGLRNILIITGDPPKLGDYPDATAVFDVDAIGLTNMVTRLNHGLDLGGNPIGKPTGYLVGVGANPGAMDLDHELRRFEYKVEAGAEFAVTQPVFDVGQLESFLQRIERFRIPVIAGIWPLASLRNAEFMNNEVPGVHVPEEILERMRAAEQRAPGASREEGIEIARETLRRVAPLVQGAQVSAPFGKAERALDVIDALRS